MEKVFHATPIDGPSPSSKLRQFLTIPTWQLHYLTNVNVTAINKFIYCVTVGAERSCSSQHSGKEGHKKSEKHSISAKGLQHHIIPELSPVRQHVQLQADVEQVYQYM